MKTLIIGFTLILFGNLFGCMPTVSTLTGKYQDTPYEIRTDKPYETIWSNVIDLFAQKGLSIKIIDKSSGLIVSEKISFLTSYTSELNGHAQDPNAFIVLNRITDPMDIQLKPDHILGEWNVRVKPTENGGTIINVNLTNIDAGYQQRGMYGATHNFTFEGKSTGKFESMIAELIR